MCNFVKTCLTVEEVSQASFMVSKIINYLKLNAGLAIGVYNCSGCNTICLIVA